MFHNRQTKKRCFSKRRPDQSKYLIYPEDSFKNGWDLYVAVILIFTCLVTPYRIALIEKDKPGWMWLNYFIDFSFFVDMIFIFNSAYYDEEFNEI